MRLQNPGFPAPERIDVAKPALTGWFTDLVSDAQCHYFLEPEIFFTVLYLLLLFFLSETQ